MSLFPTIKKYVQKDDTLIHSDENSKDYIDTVDLCKKHSPGGLSAFIKMHLPVATTMTRTIWENKISASSIKKNPKKGNITISDDDFVQLEEYIKSLDIDLVGYTKVLPANIFTAHSILYENAIVIIMKMKPEEIETSPSVASLKEVFRTYYGLGVAVNKISSFLREKGFNAMAGPAMEGDTNYVALAENAGLGAIGKHGMLITDKDYGPSLRIAVVYTDIENLPFATQNEHLWIKDFCKKCGKCARNCPAQAINDQYVDETKCILPFSEQHGCGVCLKSCTFFSKDYATIKALVDKQKAKQTSAL
ncbi:4Fe-4S binding protein [Candidatus Epulonipiscium viviparus]|uniref:4Fe-4S binding protein n=1 Tax=Candidatus Epulonipiscium viviparus TaxID=420336 RepID=UPI0027380878|nr:4Fe-4S binding protein [Candidatus Epulopiscium viviparus]